MSKIVIMKHPPFCITFNSKDFEIIREFTNSYTDGAYDTTRRASEIARRTNPPITTRLCTYCNQPAENYHHPDYSMPEAVIPVCRNCHEFIHRDIVFDIFSNKRMPEYV